MAAKLLAFLFLIFGLLRGIHGQHEDVAPDLDAHTDQVNDEGLGNQFTPDESDIKTFDGYNTHEKQGEDYNTQEKEIYEKGDNNHDHTKDQSGYDDNIQSNETQQQTEGDSQVNPINGAVDHDVDKIKDDQNIEGNGRQGLGHPAGMLTNEKLTDDDILKNEIQREQEANERNNQLREDLLKAEQHDNHQQISEKLKENGKKTQQNKREAENNNNGNNNNYNNETQANERQKEVDGDSKSSERRIKEIHDTIEEMKTRDNGDHRIQENKTPAEDHMHETKKHQDNGDHRIQENKTPAEDHMHETNKHHDNGDHRIQENKTPAEDHTHETNMHQDNGHHRIQENKTPAEDHTHETNKHQKNGHHHIQENKTPAEDHTHETNKHHDNGDHHIQENKIPAEDHMHETNKHQEADHFNRKEQKSLKISKLIFAGKKNGEDVKHLDTSPLSAERQNGQSIVKKNDESTTQAQPSDSPPISEKSVESAKVAQNIQNDSGDAQNFKNGAVNGGSTVKPWVNEIVMTDGGIMHLKNNANHLVDAYSDSNDLKVVLKTQDNEEKSSDKVQDVKIDENKDAAAIGGNLIQHHQEAGGDNSVQQNKHDSNKDENNGGSENTVKEQTMQQISHADKSAGHQAGDSRMQQNDVDTQKNDDGEHKNKEHKNKEEKSKEDTDVKTKITSEEHTNGDKKQEEVHNANQINKSISDTRQRETKEEMEDKKLVESSRFIELKKYQINQYLNDNYKGIQVSSHLLKQITDLITNDLKQQLRKKEKDISTGMEEKDDHSKSISMSEETKDIKSSTENIQAEEKEHTSGIESDNQNHSMEVAKHEKHTSNEENDDKSITEPIRKSPTEKNDGRPAKSFLSSMVRSSLSLAVHEKSHESSVATARSSFSSVTMATEDNSRSDVTLNTASTSVSDILSTTTSQPQAAIILQGSGNEADKHIASSEIDDSGSADSSKQTDKTKTNIFTQEENDEMATSKVIGDKHSISGKSVESDSQVENETKQEKDINLVEFKNIGSTIADSTTKGILIKPGDPFNLSIMSDPDPKINRWLQLPLFQELRKKQVDDYIDAQFAGKYVTEDELRYIDDLISRSMRKDLSVTTSGLHAWIKDSMGGDDVEDNSTTPNGQAKSHPPEKTDPQAKPDHHGKADHEKKVDHKEKANHEELIPAESAVTDDKSESIDKGISQDTANLKLKKNKLMKILIRSHPNNSQHQGDESSDASSQQSIVSKEEQIDQDASDEIVNETEKEEGKEKDENEIKDDDQKTEGARSYLDSIWGFFGGSSNNDAPTDKDSSEENKEIVNIEEINKEIPTPDTVKVESDADKEKPFTVSNDKEATKSDDTENFIMISPAEDYEGEETESTHEDKVVIQTTNKSETTTDPNISKEAVAEEASTISTSNSDKLLTEGTKPTATTVVNKTSEVLDAIISKESEHEKVPTSSAQPTAAETTPTTVTATTADTNVIDTSTGEESKPTAPTSSIIGESGETPKQKQEIVESVDMDHEKVKYKEAGHENTTKESVEADKEDGKSEPLKKLCKKYPTLKACQNTKPASPTSQPKEDTKKMNATFATYIKYFTKCVNNWFYGVFTYVVQCIKSLVKILCYYTVGTFLNIMGREQVSVSMMEELDSITTERFAVFIFLVTNYAAFYWYFKNSTMHPVVKITDGFDTVDYKKLETVLNQLDDLKKEMVEVTKEKEKIQKEVEKEIDINQKMHQENKDLKRYIEETKGDKKLVKELQKSMKDHENKIKAKDNELEKLRLSIQSTKDDLKSYKDDYKQLEEKFRYVEKESDSKDATISDMEDLKEELENQLLCKDKDITEKEEMLKNLNESVNNLQTKQSDLENSMKEQQKITQSLEVERKALQETLLNIDKINYEGKLENGFHTKDVEDGAMSLDEDVKAERLQNIINAIKLKAEHLEAVTELNTCKEDLSIYRKKADELEGNMNGLSSKFETLTTESYELKKEIEKKNIELQTITKFFGDREVEFQRSNVTQKEEIHKLSKQMNLIGDDKRELSDLIKKIDDLKDEIVNNQKDYKDQLASVEEQSHSNYLKMRTSIRECDEHKREKEVYRKRLLDIDMTPQAKKTSGVSKPSTERSDSPGSNKSTEGLQDTSILPSAGQPTRPTLPPPRPPFVPPMFRGAVPQFRPNPMGTALYRVPPVGQYGMPSRPQYLHQMRQPMPHNAPINPSNIPMNRPNAPMNLSNASMVPTNASTVLLQPSMSVPNAPVGALNAQMGVPNVPIGAPNTNMGAPSIPMSASNAQMNPHVAPMNPPVASMNTTYTNIRQPTMVPYPYSSHGQRPPMYTGQRISTPPRFPGSHTIPHGVPMIPNQSTPNVMPGGGHPTRNMTPAAAAAPGVPLKNS